MVVWNKGLTKELDTRLKISAERQSQTKKRLFNEGKLTVWGKGLKIWESRKHPMLGKHHTKKTKEKLSKANRGRKISNKTREKLRVASSNRKHSEETKRKISKGNKGKKRSIESRNKMRLNHWSKNGGVIWSKGLTKETDKRLFESGCSVSKTRKKLFKEGKLHSWNEGLTKETSKTLRKISKKNKGRKMSDGARVKMSANHWSKKGMHSWCKGLTKETDERVRTVSEKLKKNFKNPVFLKLYQQQFLVRPTTPERKMRKLLKILNLPYKYTGNFSFWINGRNPDFVNCNGQKKLIEVFGDYWHGKQHTGRSKEQEESRLSNHYAKYGWKTLVIWEHELSDLKAIEQKVVDFDDFKAIGVEQQ